MSRPTFSALHEKVGSNIGLILDVPRSSLGTSKRKWHSAFITIYCSRAFLSLRPSTHPKHTNSTFISRTLSYSIVRVEPVLVPAVNGFQADQKSLTELVKEKNLKELSELGGVEEVASALKTDAEHGINGDDAEGIARRHEAFGSNTYKKPPTQGFLHFVWEAFKDLTILILLGCAALSLGFGTKEHGLKDGWIDGGSICLAVILVISVSAISNYRQSRQFDKLSKVSNNLQIEAVRNGRRQQISIFEIVVGDVIFLKIGDQVPADGLLLDGHSLSVDESSMTGESDHVEISVTENPFLFSGTKIADGYGRMLVTSVGMNTNWGEMMSQISQDTSEKTPLQARLDKLTSSIGKVGLAVAFFVLVVMLVRYFTGNTEDENGNKEYNGSKTKSDDIINAVIGIVAAAVTIVVVAIPEGLPLAVTLTLAYSMKGMMVDNAEHGINGDDAEDIARRHEAFDSNTYKKPPTQGFLHFVWEAFKDLTILILLGCAALSLGFGIKEHGLKDGWIAGGSICLAVILVISVSAISNYRQSRQFDKLPKVSNNIQRESDHVEISVTGTKIDDGRMLVTSVGMNTNRGEMMSQISQDTSEKTTVRARLDKLTSLIGEVRLAVAFFVLVVMLVHTSQDTSKKTHSLTSSMSKVSLTAALEDENQNKMFNGSKTESDGIINAIIGIVSAALKIVEAAIPESLPIAVTLTLAYSMKRMMVDNAMVRKLSALEIMGSATAICTDKTGTLTMNQMKVTKFWLGKECVEEEAYSSISPYVLDLIQEGVHRPSLDSEIESPTEKAILSWAVHDTKMDMEKVVKSCSILHVEAFNSKKKQSGVLVKRKADNSIHVHWKGAAEMILAMCKSYYNATGDVKDMDENEKRKFEHIIQGMAASSLRCIAFAHKQVPAEEQINADHKVLLKEDGLTLLGLVGLKDPCRPCVRKAVEDCQYAGVKVKMITGDNVFTAKAIATECGILRPGQEMLGAVIEGVEFRNYTLEQRMEKVEKICVMARSSPSDKLLMVQCLKQKGHVVAVMGDGTNDAPALKEADIGLSMGIQGTEVAKESSNIVIMNDNFASVATVLMWGRCVYNNIQKFIQFQLTTNATLVISFVAAVSAGQVPLTAVQLLWVNLIMDTLGALALATEKPTRELMEKPPVGRTAPLITNIMWRNLLPQALYQITVLLILRFRGKAIFGVSDKVKDTLILNTFVLCQIFNVFNARMLEKKNVFKGILSKKLFTGIIALTIVLQVVMVEILKKFADTERLNWGQWGVCIGIAVISWPIGWLVKSIPVPEKPIFSYLKMKKNKH